MSARIAAAFSVMRADEGLRLRARPGSAPAGRGALGPGGLQRPHSPGSLLMSSTAAPPQHHTLTERARGECAAHTHTNSAQLQQKEEEKKERNLTLTE